MRGKSLYFVFILIAYTVGIWTFSLIPKILMTVGLTGLALMVGFSLIIGAMVTVEVNGIMKKAYRVHEFMTKIGRTPTVSLVLLAFLFIVTSVISHYTGVALEKILGLTIPGVGVLVILLGLILLIMAKSKSLDLIVVFSILLVILTIFAAAFLGSKVDNVVTKEASYQYISTTLTKLHTFTGEVPISIVVETFLASLLTFGLGVGFYYVIGSSLATVNLDIKKILVIVILLQIFLSFLAALIVTYSIGISHQAYWSAFEKGQAAEAMEVYNRYFRPLWKEYTSPERIEVKPLVETIFGIPEILKKLKIEGWFSFTLALMLSIFLAGFTTILVLLESGAQLAMDVFQISRKDSLVFAGIISAILAGIGYFEPLRAVLVATIVTMIPIYSLVELLPLMKVEEYRGKAIILMVVLIALWVPLIIAALREGKDTTILGIIVGGMLLIPLAFNKILTRSPRG
ncbi:sodium-dependent transporter [Pyrococcus kukulkanii]|uniref:sodium-dependent transporter n=1 Tax=Pyrococcus kukulkanii TaxID=1609559 RepID=UPI003565F1D9